MNLTHDMTLFLAGSVTMMVLLAACYCWRIAPSERAIRQLLCDRAYRQGRDDAIKAQFAGVLEDPL